MSPSVPQNSPCLRVNFVSQWWSLLQTHSPQRHRVPQRHKRVVFGLVLALTSLFVPLVHSQVAQPLEDPAIEQRMKNLTKQLRCLVCQNETLADSQAPLAEDLRREIRAQIKAGKTDQEIMTY